MFLYNEALTLTPKVVNFLPNHTRITSKKRTTTTEGFFRADIHYFTEYMLKSALASEQPNAMGETLIRSSVSCSAGCDRLSIVPAMTSFACMHTLDSVCSFCDLGGQKYFKPCGRNQRHCLLLLILSLSARQCLLRPRVKAELSCPL